MIDLAALERMEREATKGPWTVALVPTSVGSCFKVAPINACLYMDGMYPYAEKDPGYQPGIASAQLIVALRNAAPYLLACARVADAARGMIHPDIIPNWPPDPSLKRATALWEASLPLRSALSRAEELGAAMRDAVGDPRP